MNATCAAVECYVISDDNRRTSRQERVIGLNKLKIAALETADRAVLLYTDCLHNGGNKFCSHKQIFAVGPALLVLDLNKRILVIRTQAYSKVAGERPCCGRPDNDIRLFQIYSQAAELTLVVNKRELNIN